MNDTRRTTMPLAIGQVANEKEMKQIKSFTINMMYPANN